MSSCSTLGSTSTLTCVWKFNNKCELLSCELPPARSWINWNDCSMNCCSLSSYTRQAVQQCINLYNQKLAIALSLGLGYPLICIFVFCIFFKGKCDATSICMSLFWFIIPFLCCYQACCQSFKRRQELKKQNKNISQFNASETTNQIALSRQNNQIKNELKNIRDLINNQKNNYKVERQKSLQNCIICQQRKRQVIGECGHFCSCKLCSFQLKSCPICRKTTNWKEVYLS